MPKNIWIRIVALLFAYIRTSFLNLCSIFMRITSSQMRDGYTLVHEMISVGPDSFAKRPTAIRIARTLFVPLLLISQLYDRQTPSSK
jgi:hypothetical protein